jgi:hypothetical protein
LDFRQKRPDFEIFPVIFPVSREFAPADGFAGTACTTKIFSNINRLHGLGARAAARRPVLATNSYTAKAIATNVAQSLAMSVMAAHSLFNIVLCEFGQAPIPLKINPPANPGRNPVIPPHQGKSPHNFGNIAYFLRNFGFRANEESKHQSVTLCRNMAR